tara:strand:+ start:202 stop:756 length:555 start_codon:yes stop_codon:yes gene_type:complete
MMRRALVLVALLASAPTFAANVSTQVCFNYGCNERADVHFGEFEFELAGDRLATAVDAASEREALREALALLYRLAGRQTPIAADRAGNLRDAGVHGRMDCIDHSTTTDALLRLIEARDWLRHHDVNDIAVRRNGLFSEHRSAVIVERGSGVAWVVDTWFVDHAEPAIVMPLDEWMNGGGPNVY